MSTVRFIHTFPPGNTLNPFGDFKSLVLTATRATDDPGANVVKAWTLIGDTSLPEANRPTARTLTPDQTVLALEAIFFENAKQQFETPAQKP